MQPVELFGRPVLLQSRLLPSPPLSWILVQLFRAIRRQPHRVIAFCSHDPVQQGLLQLRAVDLLLNLILQFLPHLRSALWVHLLHQMPLFLAALG